MRRISLKPAVIAGLLLLGALLPSLAQSAGPGLVGDVNGDGRITSADALAVYAFLAGRALPPSFDVLGRGDADGDGAITRADAELIMRAAVGKSDPDRPIGKPRDPGALPASGPMMLRCEASVATRNVSCTDAGAPANGDAQADRITYGGQNVFVRLISSNVLVTADTFAFDVRVVNLIPQPIGTEDGVNPDTVGGVRVFFATPVRTTSQNGPANVVLPVNHHGEANFIGSEPQRFYAFPGVLAQGDTAAAQRWKLQFGENVTTFSFVLYVSSPVQFPNGWVDVYPRDTTVFMGATVQLTDSVRNQVGKPISGAPSWSTSDGAVATVSAAGLVTAAGAGTATITATAPGGRTGTARIRVLATPTGYRVTATNPAPGAGDTITLSAQVVDGGGSPVALAGRTVAWSVTPGRGTLLSATSATDAAGLATVRFVADSAASATADTIQAGDGSVTGALAFTTVAGAPARYRVSVSDSLPAPRDTVIALAQLTDRFGNAAARAGRLVDFTATGGATFADSALGIATNAAGQASVRVVPNDTVGTAQTVTVTDDGAVTGSTPVFSTRTGGAAGMTIAAGGAQTATAGSAVPVAPSVRVADVGGNPVAGVSVTFAVASGGGSVTDATRVTGPDGIATAGGWTLGTTAGSNTLTATAGDLTATFNATGAVGAAANLVRSAGDDQSAPAGSAVPVAPQVTVTDANGNPVPGLTVGFAVVSGGGSVTNEAPTTDAAGRAAVGSWTLGTLAGAGSDSLSATVGALTVKFAATATAGAAARLAMVTQPAATSRSGMVLTRQPALRLEDAYGNAVAQAGVQVTAARAAGGGTLGGTLDESTTADGAVAFADLAISGAAGAHTLTFSAPGLAPATSDTIQVAAGAAAALTFTVQPSAVAAGSDISPAVEVTVVDAFGNPVADAADSVTVALSADAARGTLSGATRVAPIAGVATFAGLSVDRVGPGYTLAASSASLPVATSAVFGVTHGALARFRVEKVGGGELESQVAGVPFTVQVIAVDTFGNVVTSFGGTVQLTTDPAGGLSSAGTSAAFEDGLLTIQGVTIGTAATYTLLATDGSKTGASNAVQVAPTPSNLVWTGALSTRWSDPGNWNPGIVPTANDTAAIGAAANQPLVTDANVSIRRLVMTTAGTTLDLDGFTLTLAGDLDAPAGVITRGMVEMSGSGALARGTVNALRVSGSAKLAGSTQATGAVSVTGSLNVADHPLTIRIP